MQQGRGQCCAHYTGPPCSAHTALQWLGMCCYIVAESGLAWEPGHTLCSAIGSLPVNNHHDYRAAYSSVLLSMYAKHPNCILLYAAERKRARASLKPPPLPQLHCLLPPSVVVTSRIAALYCAVLQSVRARAGLMQQLPPIHCTVLGHEAVLHGAWLSAVKLLFLPSLPWAMWFMSCFSLPCERWFAAVNLVATTVHHHFSPQWTETSSLRDYIPYHLKKTSPLYHSTSYMRGGPFIIWGGSRTKSPFSLFSSMAILFFFIKVSHPLFEIGPPEVTMNSLLSSSLHSWDSKAISGVFSQGQA